MTRPFFIEEVQPDGVAWVTLTRPDVHNAFNDVLIARLTRALEALAGDSRVRALVLAARGRSFSAGADLKWMQAMAGFDEARNQEDALALGQLMAILAGLPMPTLAMVQGPAYGGGVGLVACCDIAVAAEEAHFALSEVKLGLIPAVIAPYVVAAMGERAARRYFLTGERFSAWEAQRQGLLHEVVPASELSLRVRMLLDRLLAGGPRAQAEAKNLVRLAATAPRDQSLVEETARRIARIRVSPEGQEGVAAFLEKRKPAWSPD